MPIPTRAMGMEWCVKTALSSPCALGNHRWRVSCGAVWCACGDTVVFGCAPPPLDACTPGQLPQLGAHPHLGVSAPPRVNVAAHTIVSEVYEWPCEARSGWAMHSFRVWHPHAVARPLVASIGNLIESVGQAGMGRTHGVKAAAVPPWRTPITVQCDELSMQRRRRSG